jgi:hypothetical protein
MSDRMEAGAHSPDDDDVDDPRHMLPAEPAPERPSSGDMAFRRELPHTVGSAEPGSRPLPDSDSDSDSGSSDDDGEDLETSMANIKSAFAEANASADESLRQEAAARDALRKQAISNAEQEAQVAQLTEAAKEKAAQDRAQGTVDRTKAELFGPSRGV